MAGASAAFYLSRAADDAVSLEIHQRLEALCSHVETTRKGRGWTVWIGEPHPENSHPFFLHLKGTGDNLLECEDEMLELGIDETSHPSYLEIAAGCNQEEGRIAMNRILKDFAALGGVAGHPEK